MYELHNGSKNFEPISDEILKKMYEGDSPILPTRTVPLAYFEALKDNCFNNSDTEWEQIIDKELKEEKKERVRILESFVFYTIKKNLWIREKLEIARKQEKSEMQELRDRYEDLRLVPDEILEFWRDKYPDSPLDCFESLKCDCFDWEKIVDRELKEEKEWRITLFNAILYNTIMKSLWVREKLEIEKWKK